MRIDDVYSIEFLIEDRLVSDTPSGARIVQDLTIILTGWETQDRKITPEEMEKKKKQTLAFDKFTKEARVLLFQYFVEGGKVGLDIYNDFMKFTSRDYEKLYRAYSKNDHKAYVKVFQERAEDAMVLHIMERMFPKFLFKDIDRLKKILSDKYPNCPTEKINKIDEKLVKDISMLNAIHKLSRGFSQQIHDKYILSKQEYPDTDDRLVLLHEIVETILIEPIDEKLLVKKFSTEWYAGMHAMCQQEHANITIHQLTSFLENQKIQYWSDSLFDKEMNENLKSILSKNPNLNINSSAKHKYKSKDFYKDTKAGYLKRAHGLLNNAAQEDADLFENQDIYTKLDTRLFDVKKYRTYIKKYFKDYLMDFSAKRDAAIKREQDNQAKKTIARASVVTTNTNITITTSTISNSTPDQNLDKKFQEVITSFKQATNKKLSKTLDEIEAYIWRMYKKKTPVQMKRIERVLWSLFDQEIIDFVWKLCTKLDLPIKELDSHIESMQAELETVTNGPEKNQTDDKESDYISPSVDDENSGDNETDRIDAWKSYQKSKETDSAVETQTLKSPTFEKFKTQAALLQAEDIIKMFEESQYSVANPKKFTKQLDALVTNNGILFDRRRKKLIEYLSRDEDVVWKTEIVRYTIGQYRVLKFTDRNNPPRIVRKWDTILACIDHDTYEGLLIMMKKNANIDHLL